MKSKTLVVVGMHRSGTSLVTNWLYHCGLQVGECLLAANQGNVEGHFEDVEFLKMHEEILTSNNFPATGYVYEKDIPVSIYQHEKLKTIIRIKNQRYKQWGWKEPRTCLFLDLYRKLLPNAKYLVIVRDHSSVVNSLLKRDFSAVEQRYLARAFFARLIWRYFRRARRKQRFYRTNAEYFLKVWIAYNEHILNMLKELPQEDYMVINYSLLENRDEQVFSFLTNKWNLALQYFSFRDVYNKNLISPPFNIDQFVCDTALLSKAKVIEENFKAYMKTYQLTF